MPSDKELLRELRKVNARLDEQKEENEKREQRLREEMRKGGEPPDGMSRMREGFAENDPAAIREARRAARRERNR